MRVEDRPAGGATTFLSTRKAYFQVTESFGGVAPEAREIELLTGRGGGDCGIPFKPGDVYLVAAVVAEDGLLRTGICSPTRRIETAGAILRALRQQRDGKAPPALVGRILQQDRDYSGRLSRHIDKPLANTTIRLKSSTGLFETTSDAEGIYAFQALPGGRYEFDPVLPPGTTLASYLGSEDSRQSFQLSGLGCWEQNMDVFASGSIEGRVLDSAKQPLPGASVYLIPADQPIATDWRDLYREYQDKAGRFKFIHLSPGRYQVLVNPDDLEMPSFPYPRTFLPGVRDREAATIITVAAGEQVKGADIHLRQQFTPRHVAVRVKWADGQPVRTFVYIVATGTTNPKLRSDTSNDDKRNVGDLELVPTESYEVNAKLVCRYADANSVGPGATLTPNTIEIKPEDGQAEITLTIPSTACPEVEGKTLVKF
ncbi:MAG: hypothetical protein QM757_32235 [Paludibaculum sp.]